MSSRVSPAGLTILTVDSAKAELVRTLMLAGFEQFRGTLDPPSGAFTESIEDVARAIERGGAGVAWLDGNPVGSIRFEPEEHWLYIGRLAVVPAARRKGVAAALMMLAEREAARFGLQEAQVEVRSALPGNIELFESLGYEPIWSRPHPRNPQATTVRLRKSI